MAQGSRFLSVMVVGNNPEELMKRYDKAFKVKPYVKFKYLSAEKMKNSAIKILTEITNNPKKFTLNDFQRDYFKERLKAISSMTPFEYYSTITQGLYYDENGDALSTENPDGKWDSYHIGRDFSYPLKLKDGKEVYQAHASEIDWDAMHMNTGVVRLFETIWALVKNDDDPSTEDEKALKENWKDKQNYLSNFKSCDEFVAHNCAYWNYAFLDENGWVDVDDENNQAKWISEFVERFVDKLKDDDLVTIYEYSVKN